MAAEEVRGDERVFDAGCGAGEGDTGVGRKGSEIFGYHVVETFEYILGIDYMMVAEDTETCVYEYAEGQAGHFTRRQAIDCGMGDDDISYHIGTGRYSRESHGVYRIRNFPDSPIDRIMAAWLAVGAENAVVSHETALRLHGLSDVIPRGIHFTIPRGKRVRKHLPGVRLHTTTREFGTIDVVLLQGMRTTSVARTIVDCAQAGTGPEQIEMAVQQALAEGMTTTTWLSQTATCRSRRVRDLMARSIELSTQ